MLSAAGGRDLVVIPQILDGGLNMQNLLRSNSTYKLYCKLLYLAQYKWVISYLHILKTLNWTFNIQIFV